MSPRKKDQEETNQLSDRELLIRTYGYAKENQGILSRLVPQVNGLKEAQRHFVTRAELSIIAGSATVLIALLGLIAKLVGLW